MVRPHEAKDVDFLATRAGSYELICADHDWAGMTGRIIGVMRMPARRSPSPAADALWEGS